MYVAPNFTDKEWEKLHLDDMHHLDWKTAVDKFWQRLNTRYLRPIKILQALHEMERKEDHEEGDSHTQIDINNRRIRPGFIMLMIDCTLIETIQAFIDGVTEEMSKKEYYDEKIAKEDREYSSSAFFRRFIKSSGIKIIIDEDSMDLTNDDIYGIYKFCRNNLTHFAKTGSNYLIKDEGPIIRKNRKEISINRTLFHEKVVTEISNYCESLRMPTEAILRRNFIRKFNEICETPGKHGVPSLDENSDRPK